jgi:(2Fe-2S) ferredoxin
VKDNRSRRKLVLTGGGGTLVFVAVWALFAACPGESKAGLFGLKGRRDKCAGDPPLCTPGPLLTEEPGGVWYWQRSPEEEKRVVIGLYNRYCIRCHGVDGRGVWDIPDVPDFTNPRWQSYRSDGQLARSILEGRGAVMPPFRGAVSLEEAWAIARYLRTFVPGTEVSKPDLGPAPKAGTGK